MYQKSSLTNDTYEAIREELISCRLPPGAWLKTNGLSKRFDVSVGIVREALARLTAEGFVIAEPQRGFRAVPISAEGLRHLSVATIKIEEICLRRSIEVGDIAWESRIVAAHHALTRSLDFGPDEPVDVTTDITAYPAFRDALVSACDNPWLWHMRSMLSAQNERYKQICVQLGIKPGTDDDFNALVEATLGRRTDLAVKLLSDRLTLNAQLLAEKLAKVDKI